MTSSARSLQEQAAPLPPVELPKELSVEEAVAYASRLHRLGELDAAETIYQRVLAAIPDHPDALNFLGIARFQRGRMSEAIELVHRSLAQQPEAAGVWNNLGNMLLDTGRFEEAGDAYERCLALAPYDALVHNNLGVLRRAQRRPDEAERSYLKALALAPDADTHNNLGNLYDGLGRREDAVRHYCESLLQMPNKPETRRLLGMAYYMLGRFNDAAKIYRDWLADEPESEAAKHHLAACTGIDVPVRAADSYVEATFDGFASSFEVKLASLTYRAPQLVADTLAHTCGPARAELAILDAGCGTGLCGSLIKPWAARLEGVDLSAGMLRIATQKGVYDQLYKCELTEFLIAAQQQHWQVIVSADTLCYFGALDAVARAAWAALQSDGVLLFTVEELVDSASVPLPWQLQPHGRYAHSAAYVESCLQQAGFATLDLRSVDLRKEGGKAVQGLIVVARKPAASGPAP